MLTCEVPQLLHLHLRLAGWEARCRVPIPSALSYRRSLGQAQCEAGRRVREVGHNYEICRRALMKRCQTTKIRS